MRQVARRGVASAQLASRVHFRAASTFTKVLKKVSPISTIEPDQRSRKVTDEFDHHTARQLKQSLVGKVDQPTVQTLLFALIEENNGVLPLQYVSMAELAYSTIEAGMSLEDKSRLFQAITRNNPHEITNVGTVNKLYFQLFELNDFGNGMLYMQFLRAQGKYDESIQLLTELYKTATEPDLQKCIKEFPAELIDDRFLIALVNNQNHNIETWHEFIQAKARLGTGPIADVVPVADLKPIATTDTIIILLDACLAFNDRTTGEQVMELMKPLLIKLKPAAGTALQFYELLLMSAARFSARPKFGQKIVAEIERVPQDEWAKETRDVLAQWDIRVRDLDAMKQRVKDHADESTLVGVLKVAVELYDAKFLRQIVDYFKTLHVDCNVEAFALLINRTLSKDDPNTGLALFNKSLGEGCNWTGHGQTAVLSDLLVLMLAHRMDSHEVFNTYRRIRMFVGQVSLKAQVGMIKMFLKADCIGDAGKFMEQEFGESKEDSTADIPVAQVFEIYQVVMDHILKCRDHEDAWYLYGVLNRFVRLPHESYQPVMAHFCDLQRPDAALKVFRWMRKKHREQGLAPPTPQIYCMLFNEFGRTYYEEGVLELHLYFKMDTVNEAEMPIMNSILGAYCNLQDDVKVQDVWSQVLAFPKKTGVNNDTVTVMIKHLTRQSIHQVEHFWQSLTDYGLRPSLDNVNQYIVANCYHGYYMRAINIAKDMPEHYRLKPDEETIKQLYNWTMVQHRKDQVKQWALKEYPRKWHALQTQGSLKNYLLPETTDGTSDEMRRAEAIDALEGEVVERNAYVAALPEKQ